MSYIILKQPHPLDGLWNIAAKAVSDTQDAIDNAPPNCADANMDALVYANAKAVLAVIALPARHVDDSIYKLSITGPLGEGTIADIDREAILNEAIDVVAAAYARGQKLRAVMPDLLEGVTL